MSYIVQAKRIPRPFLSLGHARAVRDRLIAIAIRQKDLTEKEAEHWVTAPSYLRRMVLTKELMRGMVGQQPSDFTYLSELADAIEYIAKTERESLERLKLEKANLCSQRNKALEAAQFLLEPACIQGTQQRKAHYEN